MSNIKLQSSDGELGETDVEIAKRSNTIKTMPEDCGMDKEAAAVPLPNVNAVTLRKVPESVNQHKDDSEPIEGDDETKEKRTDDISSQDADFLKVDQGTIVESIMITGKTPDEFLKTLKTDFTPAEQEEIRKQWCEEMLSELNENEF